MKFQSISNSEAVALALSMYIGLACEHCSKEFTADDIANNTVWGTNQPIHIDCFTEKFGMTPEDYVKANLP